MLIVAATTLVFTGCSESANTAANSAAEKNVVIAYDRTSPEATVKEYYNSEVSKDSKFLGAFFLNSKMSQTDSLKEQLATYNVNKLQLINIYNEKTHGNYINMVCAYNTYFSGLAMPRPDVEVVTLVKKSKKWYFLNDYSNVADNDMKWINQMADAQRNEIAQNQNIQQVIKLNSTFDSENKTYLANAIKNQPLEQ